ncbi:MAG: AsmA-like C-terminal region-containing protein [Candidatus Melainabacteria bacterium]|nr:MAG: AsmA-like C-terminal region-containing protein [Candidatus Melainabacteria bacterium]
MGKVDYNLKTNKIDTKLTLSNLDANKSAKFLLEVENQIQGKLNGNLDLITTGETEDERLKNLDGNINFEINDGKLPKLGSLEYLLRAGNIIKRGPFRLNNKQYNRFGCAH